MTESVPSSFDLDRVLEDDVWYRELGDRLITLDIIGVNEAKGLVFARVKSGRIGGKRRLRRQSMSMDLIRRRYKLYSRSRSDV